MDTDNGFMIMADNAAMSKNLRHWDTEAQRKPLTRINTDNGYDNGGSDSGISKTTVIPAAFLSGNPGRNPWIPDRSIRG